MFTRSNIQLCHRHSPRHYSVCFHTGKYYNSGRAVVDRASEARSRENTTDENAVFFFSDEEEEWDKKFWMHGINWNLICLSWILTHRHCRNANPIVQYMNILGNLPLFWNVRIKRARGRHKIHNCRRLSRENLSFWCCMWMTSSDRCWPSLSSVQEGARCWVQDEGPRTDV